MEEQRKASSPVDEQTLEYFKRVKNVMDADDFDDGEQRELFVANVFAQVEHKELSLACDKTVSVVMEKMLEYFTDVQIRTILQNLRPAFRLISTDKCGSHVMESLIKCLPRLFKSEGESTVEGGDLESLFLHFCSFVKDNLSELLFHSYGSHVVRTVLEVLGGVKVAECIVRSRASREGKSRHTGKQTKGFFPGIGNPFGSIPVGHSDTSTSPESFHPILRKITKRLLKTELEKLAVHPIGSPVLQTLLLVLHRRDASLCEKLCKAVMEQVMLNRGGESKKKSGENSSLQSFKVPALFLHESGSHVVEKILHVMPPKLHSELYLQVFKGHLSKLAGHPIANYTVQHLLASCTDKAQAELVIDELVNIMEDILAFGHAGIIVKMAELCVRHGIRQEPITQALLSAFHCAGQEKSRCVAALITSLTTYDIFFQEKSPSTDKVPDDPSVLESWSVLLNYHGVMLMKILFDFENPEVFVDSFVHLPCQKLVALCGDAAGSYVAEAFLKSGTVSGKKKHKFVKKLKGEFVNLACGKHGSHVVETCWRQAEMKDKEKITAELSGKEAQLNNNFYGRMVLKNCSRVQCKRDSRSWLGDQGATTRKRVLDEIVGGTAKKETVTSAVPSPNTSTGHQQEKKRPHKRKKQPKHAPQFEAPKSAKKHKSMS